MGNESENKNNENLVPKKRGRPPNIKIPITDKLLTNNEITAKQLTNNEIITKREQINELDLIQDLLDRVELIK